MIHNYFRTQTLLLLLLPIFLGGCGLAKLSSIQKESNLVVVETTLANNLKGLERIAKIGNTGLIVKTARAHSSYSGFLEDKMEDAEIAGDTETADEMRSQAIAHYVRAQKNTPLRHSRNPIKPSSKRELSRSPNLKRHSRNLRKNRLNRSFGRLTRWHVASVFRKMTQCKSLTSLASS